MIISFTSFVYLLIIDREKASEAMEQQVCFCRTADGVRIAYAVVGEGTALVVPPPWFSHLQLEWEEPASRNFWGKLARYHMVVRFDKWGCGLSERNRSDFSLGAEVRVLETLVDHLRLKRFALAGFSQAGPIVVAYAAKHPRRVSHLILYGTWARLDPKLVPLWAEFRALIRAHWGFGAKALADAFLPGADHSAVEWFARYQCEAAEQEMAIQLIEMSPRLDVADVAHRVRAPTLVLHRRGDFRIPFQLGVELATLIPRARFVALEGKIHRAVNGDAASLLRAVATFLGDPIDHFPPAKQEPGALDTASASGIRVNTATAEVWVQGQQVQLTPKEYQALVFLWAKGGNLVSKDELATQVWPEYSGEVSDYNIDQLISRLRRKVEEDPKHSRHLMTVRGMGYRLLAI